MNFQLARHSSGYVNIELCQVGDVPLCLGEAQSARKQLDLKTRVVCMLR